LSPVSLKVQVQLLHIENLKLHNVYRFILTFGQKLPMFFFEKIRNNRYFQCFFSVMLFNVTLKWLQHNKNLIFIISSRQSFWFANLFWLICSDFMEMVQWNCKFWFISSLLFWPSKTRKRQDRRICAFTISS
jgi:hypothetical protein